MTHHATLTVATGVPVYFCDPHCPWQRASHEDINGLLRQYLTKRTDRTRMARDVYASCLSTPTAADLVRIQRRLNARPRKDRRYDTM